jgi:hypothetical protein
MNLENRYLTIILICSFLLIILLWRLISNLFKIKYYKRTTGKVITSTVRNMYMISDQKITFNYKDQHSQEHTLTQSCAISRSNALTNSPLKKNSTANVYFNLRNPKKAIFSDKNQLINRPVIAIAIMLPITAVFILLYYFV